MASIQDKAMLVRLTVHAWTARRRDKKATTEVEQSHGAIHGKSGSYIKMLVDAEYLLPIQKCEQATRDFFYANSLAWGDSGERMLPSTAFFDFTAGMRDRIALFDAACDEFTNLYPAMKQEAAKILGTLYNPLEYPADTDIRRRFGIELDFYPVPEAADFRVDVGEEAVAEIRAQITSSAEAKMKQATDECWKRLRDAVAKIDEVLTKDKPRIFESLMDTPKELVELLPKLNFSGDKKLNQLCAEVKDRLLVEADDLRRDAGLRMEIARRAADVLSKIDAR